MNGLVACSLATFYSRSRKGRWCKGETSGHYIKVLNVYLDCDRDSIIYQSQPIGPACHTVLSQLLLHLRVAPLHEHMALCKLNKLIACPLRGNLFSWSDPFVQAPPIS